MTTERRPRSDGLRSRTAILQEAARLATVEGLEGLSIGRLADAVGMSKSGLFAHFGSKEELQLATIEAAWDLFGELVIDPAMARPTGLERLMGLTENFLRHVEENVYPGGCFFASVVTEMDTRAGPVRDRALLALAGWLDRLTTAARDAQAEGAIAPGEDLDQLVFELESALLLANVQFVAGDGDLVALERARRSRDRRLAAAAPAPA